MVTNALDCTCREDQSPGTYAIGCPRHTDEAANRPPTATIDVETYTIIYYRASVNVSTPLLRDGTVWATQSSYDCEHHHETPEAAKRCARRLAGTLVARRDIRERHW